MDSQQIQKVNEKEDTKRRQNVKRRDPRIDTADDLSALSDTEDSSSKKDEITDLDIVFSIMYDEMNKEYVREKERTRERREGDKAAIPQRVFQSFLNSMNNDINEYSDNVKYHKQLVKEERKLKSTIGSHRNTLVHLKKQVAQSESTNNELKKKASQLKKKFETYKQKERTEERMKRIVHENSIIFSIPTVPVLNQVNSYDLLKGLNESIENKLKILEERQQQN